MDSVITFGVDTGVGLLMLTAATLIYLLVPVVPAGPAGPAARAAVVPGAGKKPKAGKLTWLRYLILPLIFAGSAGLYGTSLYGVSLGGIINTVTTWLAELAGSIAPGVGTVVLVAAGVVAVAVFVHDALKPAITNRAVVAAVAVPVTVGAIPGAFGAGAVTVGGWLCGGLLLLFHILFL
jgi:hypothetical protein